MAISRAARTGVRNGVMNTLGPNFRRVVRAAIAAMAVMGSGIGNGEDRRSENHRESMLALLAQLDEAPEEVAPGRAGRPQAGHHADRYLMCMARLYHVADSFEGGTVPAAAGGGGKTSEATTEAASATARWPATTRWGTSRRRRRRARPS